MVATSGAKLILDETVDVLKNQLSPRATLITPNLDEARILLKKPIESVEQMREAAEELIDQGCRAVLLKGGYLVAARLYDGRSESMR